jgi:transposase-like protein
VYIWAAIDVDSKELLALHASYTRSSIDALIFLKKVLKRCSRSSNKPIIVVDIGNGIVLLYIG